MDSNPEASEGCALYAAKRGPTGSPTYAVITYRCAAIMPEQMHACMQALMTNCHGVSHDVSRAVPGPEAPIRLCDAIVCSCHPAGVCSSWASLELGIVCAGCPMCLRGWCHSWSPGASSIWSSESGNSRQGQTYKKVRVHIGRVWKLPGCSNRQHLSGACTRMCTGCKQAGRCLGVLLKIRPISMCCLLPTMQGLGGVF